MKKCTLALTAILSLSMAVPAFAGIGVTIDGVPVPFTSSTGTPVIDENGRTLVPLRATMEAFGCAVSWNEYSKKAYVAEDNFLVTVPIGIPLIDVHGTPVAIDTEAKIIDGRVYLPIRAVLEAFGASVGWDEKSQSISVLSLSQQESIKKAENEAEEIRNRLYEEELQNQINSENQRFLDEMEEYRKEAEAERERILKEIEKSQKEADKLRKEAMYDALANSGGYGNSYVASLGFDVNLMTGGYGSTYADIAAQQYRDNLLASGKR